MRFNGTIVAVLAIRKKIRLRGWGKSPEKFTLNCSGQPDQFQASLPVNEKRLKN
jgi:hypothetical protein